MKIAYSVDVTEEVLKSLGVKTQEDLDAMRVAIKLKKSLVHQQQIENWLEKKKEFFKSLS